MPIFARRATVRAKALRSAPSPAEQRLWLALARSQVNGCKFSRQMPLGPFFVDFLCRSHRLVVEVDGFSHETRIAEDAARTRYLVQQGFRVIRFANEDVRFRLEGVVLKISELLASQSRSHPPTPSRKREGEQ